MVIAGRVSKDKIVDTMAKYGRELPAGDVLGKEDAESLRGADVQEADRPLLDAHLDAVEEAARHQAALEDEMASTCGDDPGVRLLMTIPGIGRATAIGLLSEIADVRRFETAEKFTAYAGIVPSRGGGVITKTGPAWLRCALFDAATAAARHDGRMMERYERISERRGKRKAEVAVTRTLATVIWHMLTDGAEYRARDGGPGRDAGGRGEPPG